MLNANLPAPIYDASQAVCGLKPAAVAWSRHGTVLAATLLLALFFPPRLAAQTSISISNPGFESPTPTVFPDYTVGATGWTLIRSDIDAGTFAPGVRGVTPAPIDGNQVGYANGSGGLQQVLTTTFTAGYTYTFSVYLGYRSDEINATFGTGAFQLGYIDGTFTSLASQSSAPLRGQFNFVTGAYQATAADQGRAIALRLIATGSVQIIFDHVELTAAVSAIPEPASIGCVLGVAALGLAGWRGRRRQRVKAA